MKYISTLLTRGGLVKRTMLQQQKLVRLCSAPLLFASGAPKCFGILHFCSHLHPLGKVKNHSSTRRTNSRAERVYTSKNIPVFRSIFTCSGAQITESFETLRLKICCHPVAADTRSPPSIPRGKISIRTLPDSRQAIVHGGDPRLRRVWSSGDTAASDSTHGPKNGPLKGTVKARTKILFMFSDLPYLAVSQSKMPVLDAKISIQMLLKPKCVWKRAEHFCFCSLC